MSIAEELHRHLCAGDNEYAVDVAIISLSPTEDVKAPTKGTEPFSSIVAADTIADWRGLTTPLPVIKCGITTGRTNGHVYTRNESLWTCREINGTVLKGLLAVKDIDGVPFGDDGDSGAFVLLEDKLLGIHSGRATGDDGNCSLISLAAVWAPHFNLTPISGGAGGAEE